MNPPGRVPAIVPAAPPAGRTVNDMAHYLRPGTLQLGALPPLALYVHLPCG